MKKEIKKVQNSEPKKGYQKPELTKFGTVTELTLQSGSGGGGGGGGGPS